MGSKRASVLADIGALGFTPSEAEEILSTYLSDGGLTCYGRWPEQFSFTARSRNVLDVFLDHKVTTFAPEEVSHEQDNFNLPPEGGNPLP